MYVKECNYALERLMALYPPTAIEWSDVDASVEFHYNNIRTCQEFIVTEKILFKILIILKRDTKKFSIMFGVQ